jgi:hypothetical protein
MADRYWVGGTASWDGTAGSKWALTSGGAGGQAVPTSADDVFFNAASGTNTISINAGNTGAKSINCTGFTGSLVITAPISVAGNVTLVAGMTTTFNAAITFTAAATITSAGKTLGPVTVDSSGATVTLGDACTLGSGTGLFTLLAGTFALNGFTLTAIRFNSNIGSVRTLAFGSGGQIFITGSSATVLDIGTIANMTITSGATPGTFTLTANASSGTRDVRTGLWTTEGSLFRFNVTAGSDTVQTVTAFNVDNFNLTGFTGTFTRGISDNYYGNYILNSSVTLTSTAAQQSTFVSFSGRTNTIQTFSKTLDFPITFNGNGVTWQLQDALTQGSTRTFTFSNGTIQFKNGTTNTVGSFVTSGSTLKFLASTTAGSQATISQATGTVTATYLSIQDSIATGGAIFDATSETNVNAGNNTGWLLPFVRTLFARATSNGNFLIPDIMEFNEVNQTNFRVSKNNLSVYANEFIEAEIGTKVILLESGSSWTVPADWDSTNNTIHLIGGGASSAGTSYDLSKYLGGGGGGYTKISNFNATPGSVIPYSVGLGGIANLTNTNFPPGVGANTTFNSSMYIAGGGGQGRANASIGGIGSTFNGGNGAYTSSAAGAGGGGAAGPYGNGGNAIDYLGGVGDAGFGGAANTLFGKGLSGTEINGYGSGSGGSAGDLNGSHVGGNYGGGAGSGRVAGPFNDLGYNGANGAIIITYSGITANYTQRISNTGNLLISGTFIESANI